VFAVLEPVVTCIKKLEEYRPIIGEEAYAGLKVLAEPLRGARVLHVNATPYGGGVAEMLRVLVPLMNDAGLEAEWQVINGSDDFFRVTKAMHNNLQGMELEWTTSMERTWLEQNDLNAARFDHSYDYVIIHDPQPAGILEAVIRRDGHRPEGAWLWRCHIDTSSARSQVWDFIRPFVSLYDGVIFTRREYVNGNLRDKPPVFTIWPAIDPLSHKNREASPEMVETVLSKLGIDRSKPMICQISRFDPWKDPLGVIDVYREVKLEVPGLQLVMAGSMANDDPEGEDYYQRTIEHAGGDPDIHLLCNLTDIEIGVLQQAADIVIQKSIKEGFGLTVAEAMWKGRPVVAGNVGGIPLQIDHGKTGFLADNTQEYINFVFYLLRHPEVACEVGHQAREYVRQHLLITRNLADYLRLFADIRCYSAQPVSASEVQVAGPDNNPLAATTAPV
jgi:trehalose synthase